MPRVRQSPDRPALVTLPESPAHREHRLQTQRDMQERARITDWVGKAKVVLATGAAWRKIADLAVEVGCSQGYLATTIRRGIRSTDFCWGNVGGRPSIIALAARVREVT